MKSLTRLVFLLLICPTAGAAPLYASVELPREDRLVVTTLDGAAHLAPVDAGHSDADDNQVGFSRPRISEDRDTIGWLSLYPNCCTSYPIPREIVLQKGDQIAARLRGNGLPIWQWDFRGGGRQVALRQSPTHGSTPEHYELRDISTGKLVAEFDPAEQGSLEHAPQWAQCLE